MINWIKEFFMFWFFYVVRIPSQYKDFKQMMKLQNRLEKEGYCEIFLAEFETMSEEEQKVHILIFLDICLANPEIKEENKGKFKAWVIKNMPGKSTCAAASAVMKNKDKYKTSVVKMANYAKNFGCSKK